MALSRRTGRSRFTLVLLVLTSVTVLTLDFRGAGIVDDLRSAASTVFGPVRDAAAAVFRPFSNAWNGIFGYDDLTHENDALRERIAQLEGDSVREAEALRQLEEIATLDDLQLTTDIPTVTARVVSGPLTNFEHTVELDKGSSDGLAVGMPVVTGAGLVGRVVQVSPDRSTVQLVTDPSLDIGIKLVASGEVGIAHGTGDGSPLLVDAGIDPRIEIAVGEAVTTSGVERSIFPPDIPLGTVRLVGLAPDQLTQELRVVPLADLENLSFVRVLMWSPAP